MTLKFTRRVAMAAMIATTALSGTASFADGHAVQLRMSTSNQLSA